MVWLFRPADESRKIVMEMVMRISENLVYIRWKSVVNRWRCKVVRSWWGSKFGGMEMEMMQGHSNGYSWIVFVHGSEIGGIVQRDRRGGSIRLLDNAIIHLDKTKTSLMMKNPKIRMRTKITYNGRIRSSWGSLDVLSSFCFICDGVGLHHPRFGITSEGNIREVIKGRESS